MRISRTAKDTQDCTLDSGLYPKDLSLASSCSKNPSRRRRIIETTNRRARSLWQQRKNIWAKLRVSFLPLLLFSFSLLPMKFRQLWALREELRKRMDGWFFKPRGRVLYRSAIATMLAYRNSFCQLNRAWIAMPRAENGGSSARKMVSESREFKNDQETESERRRRTKKK